LAPFAVYTSIISHRSGETEDASSPIWPWHHPGQIKTGSLSRSDRIGEYHSTAPLGEELGQEHIYSGSRAGY